ncbi:MAG TPA: TonB-dependent receptor [Telluria sp.]
MISQKRIQLTKLALALSIALSATPSFAQNTTSAIGGRISAADGKPAAGATVSIVHTESGSVSNVVTDPNGRYVARGLRSGGPYTIIITKDGVTEKRENVFLQLAETASVDATLGGAAIQTVTIAGSAQRSDVFSRSTMGAGTSITPTELQAHASINRNLQDYARTDPRVSQTDKERGEISVAGQNSRFNSLTIDGVAVNDTFGLEANGSPTAKQPISIEAIQSVQINVANYDVTQKGYTGGNINAVTKSGTNNWKGSLYYVFRDDSLVGDRFNTRTEEYYEVAPFKEDTKGFTLGGPILEDKVFIFGNYEEFSSSRSTPTYGSIGSPLTNVGITQSAIAGAQQIARDEYGMDIGSEGVPAGTEMMVKDYLVKLDWNINDNHRANVRFSRTEQEEPQFRGISQSGIALSSHFYRDVKKIDTMVGEWFGDWTPDFSTEVKLSSRKYDSVPDNNARLPAMALRFAGALPDNAPAGLSTGNRYLNFGTEYARQNNVLGTDTLDAYAGATWVLGQHELKFGADYNKNEVYNAYLQNVFGDYTFGCRDTSATYSYEFNGGASLRCSTATNAQVEAAVLENFRRGRPETYRAQIPVEGGTLSDAIAQFSLVDTGVFFQDTWEATSQLTINAGLRLDYSTVNGRPKRNDAVAQPTVAGNPATMARQTGGFGLDNTNTIDGTKLWQPRFGFNYRFDQERASQLRGGIGLFQGAAMSVWMSNPFSNPGVATRNISCSGTSSSSCPTTDGFFTGNPDSPPTIASAVPAANVDILDPSFEQPSVWKANIAFDTELPWYGLTFSTEYLRTQNKAAIYYEHLNLGTPSRIGPDGRQMFYNAAGYNPECWNEFGNVQTSVCTGATRVTNRALSNLAYDRVLNAKTTDKGAANIITMSLSRPMSKGFGWRMSYTFTDATEVSPLTSSTANSNWAGRAVFNPNEDTVGKSGYAVKDRLNASVTWQKAFFGKYKSSVGVFYEGRSGKPYSWTFENDMNGDGTSGNDLMFIPSAFGSGEVVFYGDTATSHTNEERFWQFINENKLGKFAGGVAERNSSNSPWTNSFDLRLSQEVPGFMSGHKGTFVLDFMNVGNMLNKRWGRINEVGFSSGGGFPRSFVNYAGITADNKYVYAVDNTVEELVLKQNKGESQWAIQATLRYEF